MTTFDVTLERTRRLSGTTLDFRFRRDDGAAVLFEPGQFFRFTFTDEAGEFERSYSLCNFDTAPGAPVLDLVISRVEKGRASRYLFAAREGIKARVSGPYGRLVLPATLPKRLFLVATSVGIAPYMPMLRVLESALGQQVLEVHFVFGIREPSEFLYEAELKAFAEANPAFHLVPCFSRQMPEAPGSHDRQGYVQAYLEEADLDPANDYVMLCGNPKMIDESYAMLKARGFGPRQVVREKYVFARETGATPAAAMSEEQKRLLQEKIKKFQP